MPAYEKPPARLVDIFYFASFKRVRLTCSVFLPRDILFGFSFNIDTNFKLVCYNTYKKGEGMVNFNINIVIENAKPEHKEVYYQIKKETCEKYVKKYFGGWKEQEQREYNNKILTKV